MASLLRRRRDLLTGLQHAMTSPHSPQDGEPKRAPTIKDLTPSIHATRDEHEDDPVFIKTRRLTLRFGTLFFALCGVALFAPMIVGVAQGISRGRIWDPYTGQLVRQDGPRLACMEEAQRLMMQAGNHDKLVRAWGQPYQDWVTTCHEAHPELYELLSKTREQLLRKSLKKPEAQPEGSSQPG